MLESKLKELKDIDVKALLNNKYNVLFGIGLLLSIWFFFTCAFWDDFVNISLAYPYGIIALWLSIAGIILDTEKKKYSLIHYILTAGILWSMIVLMFK